MWVEQQSSHKKQWKEWQKKTYLCEKMDPYEVIKYPVSTEKSIRLMESENKLVFRVERRCSKPEIKEAIEKMFNIKVMKINTCITPKGEKRAYIKLSPENLAIDVATQLGLM